MTVLDDERWYCYKDDLIFFPKEHRWSDGEEDTGPEVETPERPPIRYGTIHRAAIISSTLILLTVAGMGFIFGAVRASTTLLLPYDQIDAYNTLTQTTDQLMTANGGYWLLAVVYLIDFLVICVVIASAATLRSSRHKIIVFVAPFVATADILLEDYYTSFIQHLLTQLQQIMGTNILNTALQVQQKFNTAYGFWGSPEYYATVAVLSWATVGLLIVAAFTMKSVTVSESTVGKAESAPEFVPSEKPPTTEQGPSRRKFCRYCGAKIVRNSKFCEECGCQLIG
jgi:hypothetical protein